MSITTAADPQELNGAAVSLNEAASDTTPLLPLRCVLSGMLVGLLWKLSFFLGADQVYSAIPIHDSFFPSLLQNSVVLRIAFLTAIAASTIAWTTSERKLRRAAVLVSFVSATIMLLHQGTYNDMTFTTVWWCNLWALWYAYRIDVDAAQALNRKAAFLSRLILSVVLLGGAVGKWTGEYWSGEVFYEIYFRDRDFWLFNGLRAYFEPETLRWISMLYSRQVIAVETLGGLFLWLLRPRWAATVGVVIFSSIGLLSNFLLFSVLAPLIGLAVIGWFACEQPARAISYAGLGSFSPSGCLQNHAQDATPPSIAPTQ